MLEDLAPDTKILLVNYAPLRREGDTSGVHEQWKTSMFRVGSQESIFARNSTAAIKKGKKGTW